MLSVISSGQVAKQNLSTRTLVRRAHQSGATNGNSAVGGVITGSNPIETRNFLKNATIKSGLRIKNNLSKSIQNAVSFVQTQQSKMELLQKVYARMNELAGYASDPFLSENLRTQYSEEFETLKKESIELGNESFLGKPLFDEMAAKYFPPIDYGSGFSSDSSGNLNVKQGTIPISERLGDLGKFYEVEKEVYFDNGKFSLEINGGATGERYMLKQGNHIIFDTAGGSSGNDKWATVGNAWQYDFDKFEIEYSPNEPTTFRFVPQSAGSNAEVKVPDEAPPDASFDNKSDYLSQLGLEASNGDNSTAWNPGLDYSDTEFSGEVGEVKTYPAIAGETKLTLRVEASTIFQVKAEYTNLINPESSYNIQLSEDKSIDLEPVGVGLSQINSNINSPEDAKSALHTLSNELENVTVQMATIGANLSKLEFANEHIDKQAIIADSVGEGIISDSEIAGQVESAKAGIILEGSRSVLAKAITATKNIVNLLF